MVMVIVEYSVKDTVAKKMPNHLKYSLESY